MTSFHVIIPTTEFGWRSYDTLLIFYYIHQKLYTVGAKMKRAWFPDIKMAARGRAALAWLAGLASRSSSSRRGCVLHIVWRSRKCARALMRLGPGAVPTCAASRIQKLTRRFRARH
jgi:hypothetical protein